MKQQKHIPVLHDEVLKLLAPKNKEKYLDLTAGYGGHALSVIERIGKDGMATLVDRDQYAIQALNKLFGDANAVHIVHNDFLSASRQLVNEGKKFDMIFADLGVSSPHLDNADRGFSFSKEGPLDMRMDKQQKTTAADIVNEASEAELADILHRWGEVRNSYKIARHIIANRPYDTTTQLAQVVARVYRHKQKTHPATQVFQALRIAVNEELRLLEEALPLWVDLLTDNGRLAVISFHSLEDRIVKNFFSERGGSLYDADLKILTKRPIVSDKDGFVHNPRERSAKLRGAVKIKTKERGE